jgi:prepilin-type N-terminal cleavage/methylation domain-containing protein
MIYTAMKKSRGFTLIEVMVVITIVGLLASVVMAALTDARAKARDTARVQMVKEIQKALELYRNANGGNYPCATAMPGCLSGGGQVNINATSTSRNTFFDTAISPYLTVPTETVSFVPLSQGSILYRVGSSTAAITRDSYGIVLRREVLTTGANGISIPAGAPGCVIRFGPSSNTTNFTMPDCF